MLRKWPAGMHTICIVLFRTITVSIPVIPVHFIVSPKSLVTTMETEVMTIYLNRPYIKREIVALVKVDTEG